MHRHALIVGKFAPFHRGHQFLIERALAASRKVTVLVYTNPDLDRMPNAVRAGWIRAVMPDVQVVVPEDPPLDTASDLTHRQFVKDWLDRQGVSIDAVFTSELYGEGFAAFLGVAHEMVDLDRRAYPIFGSQIRADPAANAKWLHPLVAAAWMR